MKECGGCGEVLYESNGSTFHSDDNTPECEETKGTGAVEFETEFKEK